MGKKPLMFKFVDEESDDYFKSVKEDDVQYEGGEGMSMTMKIGAGVALLAVVGLVVFFATKGGAEGDAATADDTETPAADDSETPAADDSETPAEETSG